MSLTHPSRTGTPITIWFADELPVRIVSDGKRYRVSDRPTRLEDEHPDLAYRIGLTGWRFQGTDESGVSYMFDVRRAGDQWILLRAYE